MKAHLAALGRAAQAVLSRRRQRASYRDGQPMAIRYTQGDGITCPKCRRVSWGLSLICPNCGHVLGRVMP